MPPEKQRSNMILTLLPSSGPGVFKFGIILIFSPPFVKGKGLIHIQCFRHRMLMGKIFCHLYRGNFHPRFLYPVFIHTAKENILIVKAVLVLFPFKPCLSGEIKQPFASKGNTVSYPAQISVAIMVTVPGSGRRYRPGRTDVIMIATEICAG